MPASPEHVQVVAAPVVGSPRHLDAAREALPGVLAAVHPGVQPTHVLADPGVALPPTVDVIARLGPPLAAQDDTVHVPASTI